MKARHAMRFGAEVTPGGVRFALWAPGCERVVLERVDGDGALLYRAPMRRGADGWHECERDDAGAGTLYRFDVGLGHAVPDPASRFNPQGVHGPSEVVDARAHEWADADWRGRPWHEAVIGELHVGAFTPEGTLEAAAARLPQLRETGFSAVELMPLAAFAGRRGWGYDGVLPYAIHPAYGTPAQLKRFVEQAHRLGLMVLLDVVCNHFGPDGNYLHAYCPQFFDASRRTPWGPALRFEGEHAATLRRFFVDNALFWVNEYRLDGLRLDAVHAIHDGSPLHIVEEIAAALRDGPGRERHVHLVLEDEQRRPRWIERNGAGAPRVASAHWHDPWHHAAHVLATGEREGYYRPFADAPAARLAQALAEGPGRVAFLQNHDQIGNRAFGERLDAIAARARVEALLACLLLAPHVPLLFMGEEFAASTPFLFFCDHAGELGEAVRRGRREEFAAFAAFRDARSRERIPDPNAQATFDASRLNWAERDSAAGRRRRALVARLLALRREHLEEHLPCARRGRVLRADDAGFEVEWPLADGLCWAMRARFGHGPAPAWPFAAAEREVYRGADGGDAVRVTLRPSDGGAA